MKLSLHGYYWPIKWNSGDMKSNRCSKEKEESIKITYTSDTIYQSQFTFFAQTDFVIFLSKFVLLLVNGG